MKSVFFICMFAATISAGQTKSFMFDGVLGNQIDGIIRRVHDKYGISFSYNNVKQWDYKIGKSDITIEIEDAMINDEAYVSQMPVHEGSKEALETIWNRNWVTIITRRPKEADLRTKRWLSVNNFKFDEYVNSLVADKSQHPFDVLIDDYLGNIEKVLERPMRHAILIDRPWNRDRKKLKRFIREGKLSIVSHWNEIPSIIATIRK